MKKIAALILVGLFLAGVAYAMPTDRSIVKESMILVEKAVAVLQHQGKDKAFASINDTSGGFVNTKQGLYIYVFDLKGEIVSHSINKMLIGQQFIDIRDVSGKLFYQEIIKTANQNGSGWISYKLLDPKTKKIEQKECYFKKSGDLIVACATK
jgi:cytochrome c